MKTKTDNGWYNIKQQKKHSTDVVINKQRRKQ